MKKALLSLAFLTLFSASAWADTYNLDVQQSQIEWVGKKVTGKHNGTVGLKGGQLTLDGQKITGGSFVIDMKTIKVLDLADGPNQKLTTHLFSDDFFAVEKNPESEFTISSVKDLGNGKVEISGDLTIKGITKPILIPAVVTQKGNTVQAKGSATIDRTQWNIRYGSGQFFQGLGDKMISDQIELQLNLLAKK